MPQEPGPTRIGVFGGTFDPIHLGHLIAGQDVLETMALDRLYFVPARRSPGKESDPSAGGTRRLEMVREAVRGDDRMVALDNELRRTPPSYTVDTLSELAASHPSAQLFLILGVDQWAGFGEWRSPREIARLAEIVVVTREGEPPGERRPSFEDRPAPDIHELSVTRIDISSTLIRDRVRRGRSIRFLVPEGVGRIIEAEQLYR